MNTLYVVLGATGVGKTELTLRLADIMHVPVINADSRQIFAELPIGTAAPTPEQRLRVRHYFVGTHRLSDYYSASMYETDVLRLLDVLFRERPFALLSGGSMMYIDAVCKGLDDIPTVRDDIRSLYKERFAREGLAPLLEELERVDPEHYAVVDRNNPRRVMHALEICRQTGRTFTSFRTGVAKRRPFRIVKIGLTRPREEMYGRINERVLRMVAAGLVEEARRVLPYRELNSLNTVGYKELFSYFDGLIPLDEAIRQIQSNTRRYMRKQETWFKRDGSIAWFNPDDEQSVYQFVREACDYA